MNNTGPINPLNLNPITPTDPPNDQPVNLNTVPSTNPADTNVPQGAIQTTATSQFPWQAKSSNTIEPPVYNDTPSKPVETTTQQLNESSEGPIDNNVIDLSFQSNPSQPDDTKVTTEKSTTINTPIDKTKEPISSVAQDTIPTEKPSPQLPNLNPILKPIDQISNVTPIIEPKTPLTSIPVLPVQTNTQTVPPMTVNPVTTPIDIPTLPASPFIDNPTKTPIKTDNINPPTLPPLDATTGEPLANNPIVSTVSSDKKKEPIELEKPTQLPDQIKTGTKEEEDGKNRMRNILLIIVVLVLGILALLLGIYFAINGAK